MTKSEAIIEHEGDEKYILVRILEDGEEKHVVASLPLDYHADILRELRDRLDGRAIVSDVLGGGILAIDRSKMEIRTYGMSGSFGGPPVDLVREVLSENFPEYSIEAKVTGYIRG